MKRIIFFSFLLALIGFSGLAAAEGAAAVGTPAPNFTLPAQDGSTRSLADFSGKTVVLEWYNKDCPFVRKHYGSGNMQALQKDYTDKGVVWLTIVSSAPGKQGYLTAAEAVSTIKNENAAPSYMLLDPEGTVGRLYNAKTTPHMFVINPEGALVYAGAIDDTPSADKEDITTAKNYVRAALDAVLGGQAVEIATSTPYGCSVKYTN